MIRSTGRGALPNRATALYLAFFAMVAPLAFGSPGPVAAATPQLPPQVEAASSNFLETFDGKPTNPTPWNHRDWDVFQTSRDIRSWAVPDPVNAHHAFSNCGDVATGGSHTVDSWSETVFQCNDHVMTSINGTPGYAAIYMEQSFGSANWEIEVIRNGVVSTLGTLAIPYSRIGGASRVTRTPVRIVVSRTSITLSYPTVSGVSKTVSFPALTWNMGVVQFGHHSYTPLKDCSSTPQFICAANTWHWDNIGVNPARRIYQWQSTPERTGAAIRDSNARTLTFGSPAPDNALLVFSGNCGVQVRNNSTASWRSATIVGPNTHPEHTQSYRVTVSARSSSIQYRFVNNGWYGPGYGCQISNPVIRAPDPPRGSSLLTWDQASGSYAVRVMNNWTFGTRFSGQWNRAFDDVVVGDFDRDGDNDDYFVWDRNTGDYVVWTTGSSSFVRKSSGTWSRVFDRVIVGDFDSDGYVNDVFALDNNTGNWSNFSMSLFTPTRRRDSSYNVTFETIIVGDWDGDGRRDDALLWDTTTGYWVVHSFAAFKATIRSSGRWSSSFERGYNIDCDQDRVRDDLLLWDDDTGQVHAVTFTAGKPALRATATFSSTLDIGASADLNSDGVWNELFVFDRGARQWQVHRYSGCRPTLARAGTLPVSYDVAWG